MVYFSKGRDKFLFDISDVGILVEVSYDASDSTEHSPSIRSDHCRPNAPPAHTRKRDYRIFEHEDRTELLVLRSTWFKPSRIQQCKPYYPLSRFN